MTLIPFIQPYNIYCATCGGAMHHSEFDKMAGQATITCLSPPLYRCPQDGVAFRIQFDRVKVVE